MSRKINSKKSGISHQTLKKILLKNNDNHNPFEILSCHDGHPLCFIMFKLFNPGSVVDPDPYVFVPPGSGSVSGQAKIVRKTLILTVL